MVKDCENKATDLSRLENGIADSLTKEKALHADLEGLKGIFKGRLPRTIRATTKGK